MSTRRRPPARVAVIGAGAFGGWTALELVRRGASVLLLDAWGPGHSRASSGGDTRIIRAGYGARRIYTQMTVRALARWRAHDERFGRRLFRQTGALWLFGSPAGFAADTLATLGDEGVDVEALSRSELARQFPQFHARDLAVGLYEPNAGYLLARQACEHVVERVAAEGGEYRTLAVRSPLRLDGRRVKSVPVVGGSSIEADAFVFACGPWLGTLFPDVVGARVRPTRQDVFYFGTPAGDPRFDDTHCPVWIELTDRLRYGIPGNAHRGFKIADDTSGPAFDPTRGARLPNERALPAIRRYLAKRFPSMAGAPVVGGEVCQYEASPDSHFILDRHPHADNVWIAGGGSGHGFKMGPAVGEMLADLVLGDGLPDPIFRLARFDAAGGRRPRDSKWA